jgi:uncharacterized repeat protein (TIGR03803 family)
MKRQNIARRQFFLAATVALLLCGSATIAAAQTEGILHSFAGGTADGFEPYAGLIANSAGDLYGTAAYEGPGGQGIVYQLTPPSGGGTWTENILWSFTGASDGATPTSNLVMDSSGAIYGTTVFGGTYNCGTFFQLTPPGTGGTAWSENSLYQFPCFGSESATQDATAIAYDPATGIFYGILQAGGPHDGGSVYKLALSGGVWTYTTLHSFNDNSSDPGYANGCNPWSLLFGPDGDLYGTALYCGLGTGTVFRLSRPAGGGTGWGFHLLYSLGTSSTSPNGAYPYGLLIGLSGVLYGGTAEGGSSGYGTIYSLTRPQAGTGGPWTEAVIHNFAEGSGDGIYPLSGVILGPAGSLYGATAGGGLSDTTCGSYPGCGTVFQLIPGSGGLWTETVLHNFAAAGGDAINPNPGVLLERGGNLYGTTYNGGANGDGAVYAVHP